ncbi:MAG: hypothetical protein JWQ09_1178 [Segetibacter sp.]|nr:hypothetical protein [Segetibacter sp.]
MKKILVTLAIVFPLVLFAQSKSLKSKKVTSDTTIAKEEKFEPITLYFVMLMKGPNRTQDSTTAEKIQEGHMANISKLAATGKLIVAGPFMEDKNWRGIFILKTNSIEEAEALVKTDPAVVAGRLSYEIHPWMTGKNCLFK